MSWNPNAATIVYQPIDRTLEINEKKNVIDRVKKNLSRETHYLAACEPQKVQVSEFMGRKITVSNAGLSHPLRNCYSTLEAIIEIDRIWYYIDRLLADMNKQVQGFERELKVEIQSVHEEVSRILIIGLCYTLQHKQNQDSQKSSS